MARKGHHSAFAALAKNSSIGALNPAKKSSSLSKPEVQEETRGYHYDYFNTPSQPKTEVKVKPDTTIEMGIPDSPRLETVPTTLPL